MGSRACASLFKRSIVGTFHKMSIKHMDRYLLSGGNNRKNPNIFVPCAGL